MTSNQAGAFRLGDGAPVTLQAAQALWAAVTREVLEGVARRYNAVITDSDLAKLVQQQSGIHTRVVGGEWLRGVLDIVAAGCAQRGEPSLSALCRLQDRADDLATAEERLRCYEHFGAELPPGGGRPTVLQRAVAPPRSVKPRRPAASKAAPKPAREAPVAICPTCFMQLPASGRCDTCG